MLPISPLPNHRGARRRPHLAGAHGPVRNARVSRRATHAMTRTVAVFAGAALLEIAGCFAFWAWLRRVPAVACAGAGDRGQQASPGVTSSGPSEALPVQSFP